MDDLELIKHRLAQTPISELKALGKESGVPFGTLFKIKYGTTQNPRYETVTQLARYYKLQVQQAV